MSIDLAQDAADDDAARLRLLEAIRGYDGSLTLADIVARSGVPPEEAERLLNRIVREYTSELDVDEEGNLVYRFDPDLEARPDIVKADRARRRKEAFVNGLIRFVKAGTVVTIVLYTVVYVALAIAFLIASARNLNLSGKYRRRSSSSRTSSSRKPLSLQRPGIWSPIWSTTASPIPSSRASASAPPGMGIARPPTSTRASWHCWRAKPPPVTRCPSAKSSRR